MQPHEVLGVRPRASREEVVRAYRELAKQLHPDRAPGADARMAEVNAARDRLLARAGAPAAPAPRPAPGPFDPFGPVGPAAAPRARRPLPGAWLDPDLRGRIALELVAALRPGEDVHLVARAATRDSHEVQLLATDDRLLWLRDDAITGRVRSLRYERIAALEPRVPSGRFRRRGELRILGVNGRRLDFAELDRRDLDALMSVLLRCAPAA